MNDLYVISGNSKDAVLVRGSRLQAAQAFEAHVRTHASIANGVELRGDQNFRRFIEGEGTGRIAWCGYRINPVSIQESK